METTPPNWLTRISESIDSVFGPMMQWIFHPTNAVFQGISPETTAILAKTCSVGLFVATMAWVFLLRREYVDLDRPGKAPWYDLRFWTIVSMLPHVIVYLTF